MGLVTMTSAVGNVVHHAGAGGSIALAAADRALDLGREVLPLPSSLTSSLSILIDFSLRVALVDVVDDADQRGRRRRRGRRSS